MNLTSWAPARPGRAVIKHFGEKAARRCLRETGEEVRRLEATFARGEAGISAEHVRAAQRGNARLAEAERLRGEEVIEILAENPERIEEVKGIRPATAEKFIKAAQDNHDIPLDILAILTETGIAGHKALELLGAGFFAMRPWKV